jgi:hypothetical protein
LHPTIKEETMKGRVVLAVIGVAALGMGVGAWAMDSADASSALKPNVNIVVKKFSLSNGGFVNASVSCPKGTRIFSGGYASDGRFAQVTVAAPAFTGNHYILSAWMPPVNINVPVLKETATISVAAWCAPTGQPVVLGSS